MIHVIVKHRRGMYPDAEYECDRIESDDRVGGTHVVLRDVEPVVNYHSNVAVDLDYYDLIIQMSRKP